MLSIEHYERASKRVSYNHITGRFSHKVKSNVRNNGDSAGWKSNEGYIRLMSGKVKITAHRLAYYIMEGELPECVDHINGIRDDNRWINIRGCTNAENSRNRGMSKANTSGYRGVHRRKDGSWRVCITTNGNRFNKSGFSTAEAANLWAVDYYREVHGDFYNEQRC